MSLVKGEISPDDGAVVSVLVGVSRNRRRVLERNQLPVPSSIPLVAMIDTGSFMTAFRPEVFSSLQVQPFDRIRVGTPLTTREQPWEAGLYDVSVSLVSGTTTAYLPSIHAIASSDFDQDGVQGVIGRDVLRQCVFWYHGPEGWFQLAF